MFQWLLEYFSRIEEIDDARDVIILKVFFEREKDIVKNE